MIPDDPKRPPRADLFGFYYLGFDPSGQYKFPNVRHVAAFYNVSHDAVLRWLDELDLSPKDMLRRKFNLAGAQVDLMLEAPNLTREEIQVRVAKALEEIDQSEKGRRFWED